MSEQEREQASPISGAEEFPREQREKLERRRRLPRPVAAAAGLMPGGLYGTDGANLFLIDRVSGAASLVGPHGAVEVAIGAIAFDPGGTLYGMSLTDQAQLYRIDVGCSSSGGRPSPVTWEFRRA